MFASVAPPKKKQCDQPASQQIRACAARPGLQRSAHSPFIHSIRFELDIFVYHTSARAHREACARKCAVMIFG